MKELPVVKTRAKTPRGIARAYIRQYGAFLDGGARYVPYFHKSVTAVKCGDHYRLKATSVFNARPAGVMYGQEFTVKP